MEEKEVETKHFDSNFLEFEVEELFNNIVNLELHETFASQIGVSYEDFWFGSPELYWYKYRGWKQQERYNDTLILNIIKLYLMPAVSIAFNGNKEGKIKIPEKPLFSDKEEKHEFVSKLPRKIIPPTLEQRREYDRKMAEIKMKKN